LSRAEAAVASWQAEVVRPLRALRRRLKVRLADPEADSVAALWPELTGDLRARALALELDGERLAQLALEPARSPTGRPRRRPGPRWRRPTCGCTGRLTAAIAMP
jgi:hypothetical protein